MIKLKSTVLISGFKEALFRFPTVVATVFIGTLTLLFLTYTDRGATSKEVFFFLNSIQAAVSIGLPLLFALTQFKENRYRDKKWNPWLDSFGALFVVLYFIYFVNYYSPETKGTGLFRTAILSLAFHWLCAFLPFYRKGSEESFWVYNKNLFLNFWIATIYAGFLNAGLFIALGSIDYLFFRLDFETYSTVASLIWMFIHPVIFLSRAPKNVLEEPDTSDFPHGLRIFSQYVLIPIHCLYLAILYLYLFKILIAGSLPKGNVGYMVSFFAVIKIFTFLFLYPYESLPGTQWLTKLRRVLSLAFIPICLLLFSAVYERVSTYGITISRYYLLILSLWIFAVTVWFIISRKPKIRFIPMSLTIIAILSLIGPWSASHVSFVSQKNRLFSFMEKNQMVKDAKIVSNVEVKKIPTKEFREISSIIFYIKHDLQMEDLQPYFNIPISGLQHYEILKNLGIEEDLSAPSNSPNEMKGNISYNFSHKVIEINPHTFLVDSQALCDDMSPCPLGETGFRVERTMRPQTIHIADSNGNRIYSLSTNTMALDLKKRIGHNSNDSFTTGKESFFGKEFSIYKVDWPHGKMDVHLVSIWKNLDSSNYDDGYFNGYIIITVNNPK